MKLTFMTPADIQKILNGNGVNAEVSIIEKVWSLIFSLSFSIFSKLLVMNLKLVSFDMLTICSPK